MIVRNVLRTTYPHGVTYPAEQECYHPHRGHVRGQRQIGYRFVEMTRSFFTRNSDWFVPNEEARGPWDADACHAGPPTGLLARASELAVPEQALVRITVDLIRPIPHSPFRVEADVVRRGRSVSTTRMRIVGDDDRAIVTAVGMHVAAADPPLDIPTTTYEPPPLDSSVPGPFTIDRTAHGLTWFGDSVEARYRPGERSSVGPGLMWMRTPALLPDEEPSPFQRICPLADCGNAISRNAEADGSTMFMNTDLTIMLHRPPTGDWFGSDAVSRWEPSGHGISDALLFDADGAVGRALQTLLIRRG